LGPKNEEVTGGWKKSQYGDFNNLLQNEICRTGLMHEKRKKCMQDFGRNTSKEKSTW